MRLKLGPNWYCRCRLRGKAVEFSTGERDRDKADKRARERLTKRIKLLEISDAQKAKRAAAKDSPPKKVQTDEGATGDAAAANKIASIPNTVGVITLDWPCAVGIVVTPGSGQVLAVSYA